MRVTKITGAVLASTLLAATVGLSACSSSSGSSAEASGSSAAVESAAPTATGGASALASGGVDSSAVVTAETACSQIETDSAGYMQAFGNTNSEDWVKFSDEALGLSDSAEDPDLQGALMNLAVAAQFTVTGLESSEDLTTAKGDFDTALNDVNAICSAAGFPLSAATGGGASGAASMAPSASASMAPSASAS
jgi:hypothetical protein